MTSLRFLTPFAFLALVPLGIELGGAWTLSAAVAIPLCLTVLDAVLGKDRSIARNAANPALMVLPKFYIVLQLVVTGWVAVRIAGGANIFEAVGLTLSNGLTTGVFGLVAAHEMIHDRDRSDRALGLMLLASVLYMHFSISHVRGHHRDAATAADPTTATLGESVYAFICRSAVGQYRHAWRREPSLMATFIAVQLVIVLAVGLISPASLAFFLANAVLAILLLETFNYVAHYGLRRRVASDGSIEPLGPQHSWNSSNRMNNAALFNMGRHSDHHRNGTRHYQQLEPIDGAPELPSGYAAAMLTALVPPLWRRAMDARASAAPASTGFRVYNCNRIVYRCNRNGDRQENQRRGTRPHGGFVGRE